MPSQPATLNLSTRERMFVMYYCGACNFNGTAAAVRAGYGVKGAHAQASRMLSSVKVRHAIDAELLRMNQDQAAMKDRVMAEWSKLAFSSLPFHLGDLQKIMQGGGKVPAEIAHAVKKVKFDIAGGVTIELHDKKGALDSMAKALGMFKDEAGDKAANAFEKFVMEFAEKKKQRADNSLINPEAKP